MFKDRFILAASTISLIALQVMLWPLILKVKSLPSEVALWYIQPSTNQLAPTTYLWIVPAAVLGCWLFNLGLSFWLYRRFPAVAHLLAATSTFTAIFGAMVIVKTILIYTSLL